MTERQPEGPGELPEGDPTQPGPESREHPGGDPTAPGPGSREPQWLAWAKRIQAIAQAGITYTHNPYDLDRYRTLQALSVEIVARHVDAGSREDLVRLGELFAADSGYPTPKVDVRAFVERDGEVLLVRERADGRWSLPGGWADVGSSPAEMAVREVAEESGYQVRATRLLAVWERARHNPTPSLSSVYKLAIACEITGGRPEAGYETLGVGWFGVDDLPELSLGRITAEQIRRLAVLAANPELPPDLD
ncbi:MAG TPA: NUDIX hydrolase [Actinomycetes bacterium]|nr:NUDIX hydrolase [Actinomycetes bacterium]